MGSDTVEVFDHAVGVAQVFEGAVELGEIGGTFGRPHGRRRRLLVVARALEMHRQCFRWRVLAVGRHDRPCDGTVAGRPFRSQLHLVGDIAHERMAESQIVSGRLGFDQSGAHQRSDCARNLVAS